MSITPDYDVLIVGAGFSGIGAAFKLDRRGIHPFRVDRSRRRSRRLVERPRQVREKAQRRLAEATDRMARELLKMAMEILARWLARYAGWIVAVVAGLLVLCGLSSAHLSSRPSGGGWTAPGYWWLPDGITPYCGSIHRRSHDRSPGQSNEEGVQWVP